ncbi:hypothetical protein [Geofilum rubicundum]|uniref:Uncharacterized protein n=1 Tax=Geofilum rubicundum JCM 15548 TaxID=1236989 RepID=A0A0E9M2W4_9BACT|nr:hypothetical protein [Geofilum rubicundum]GAO31864.1 hypothetical protein JCM15548_14268 [Geofilum rubicundum JCM 15548]
MADFKYQKPFPIQKDTTNYRLLTKDYVSTIEPMAEKFSKLIPGGWNSWPGKPFLMYRSTCVQRIFKSYPTF